MLLFDSSTLVKQIHLSLRSRIHQILACSNTNKEHELVLDRHEKGLSFTLLMIVAAIVILLSARGTTDSDNWYLQSPEKAMLQS